VFDIDSGQEQIASDPRSIEKFWYGNTYRWWTDFMDKDPLTDLLQLDIPVLVGIGEQDQSEPVESALFLASQFRQAGKHNLVLKVYPGANHGLRAPGVAYRDDFFAELGRLLQPEAGRTTQPAETPGL